MNAIKEGARVRDFIRLLHTLESLYVELGAVVRRKLEAMRHCRLDDLRRLGEQEQELTVRVRERAGFGRQLLQAVAAASGKSPAPANALCVTQILAWVAPDERAPIAAAVDRLRRAIFQTAQANRIVEAASRETLNHLRWVFLSVRPQGDRPTGYSGSGAPLAVLDQRILDAVG